MLSIFRQFRAPRLRQEGLATLTVVVLLLLIMLLILPFAIRMGVFEQRTSINENRTALATGAAEAALNQGLEFIKANARVITSTSPASGGFQDGWLFATNPSWQPCTVAVASTVLDPCLSEPDTTRRAQMYRFNRGGNTNLPLASLFGSDQLFTSVGGFNTVYSVSATLCLIQPGAVVGAVPSCALTPTSGSGNSAVTIVSQATLPTENAKAMVREVIASFRVISTPPNVPIVSSNTISGLGDAEIVPNPNAGGPGVPLSIWTNTDVNIGSGAFSTCNLGEFLSNYNTSGPQMYDGITICPGCGCKGLTADQGLLSGRNSSWPTYKGVDIMDISGNLDALPDTQYFPKAPYDDPNNNFDNSIFDYVMGSSTTAQGATTPSMTCVSTANPGGNCEDQFLFDIGAKEVADCSTMTAASSGLYWVHGDCSIGGQVGTPSNPAFLLVDGCVSVNAQMQYYGLIYMRGRNCASSSNAFKSNGGGQLYGAVIIDAPATINGSVQIIYNDTVLKNLGNSPDFKRYGVIPGTWTDKPCFNISGDCKGP